MDERSSSKKRIGRASIGTLLAVLSLIALETPASALTFRVDSSREEVDASLGDGICASVSGACTLRAALGEAEALERSVEILRPALADPAALRTLRTGDGRALGGGPRVAPLTLTVDSTDDAADAAPGDGVCATASGVCTLRAAVQEANDLPGPQTIALAASHYTLTITGTPDESAETGDLDVLDELFVTGVGSALTTIDAGDVGRVFDNFHFLTLSGVHVVHGDPEAIATDFGDFVVTDGRFTDNAVGISGGGGVLTIADSHFEDNDLAAYVTTCPSFTATDTTVEANGAGFYFDLSVKGTVKDVTFRSNVGDAVTVIVQNQLRFDGVTMTENGAGLHHGGGDLSNYVTIVDSTITDNASTGVRYSDGSLVVDASTITGNGGCAIAVSGYDGSGLSVRDSLLEENGCGVDIGGSASGTSTEITGSTIRNNNGLGVSVVGCPRFATLSVSTSTIRGNRGGGLFAWGVNGTGPEVTIRDTTIADNRAPRGAGILVTPSSSNRPFLAIVNTTISGNVATDEVDGILNEGGDLDLRNVTVADHAGEGLLVRDGGTVTTRNSILDGGCSGTVTSAGHNLMGPGCNVVGDLTGNLSGDPLLGPLGDNGGPTVTHALLAASPGRDAGDPAGCLDLDDALLVTDQRGSARPELGRCDIGAFEATCGNGTVDPGETCDDGNDDDGDCCSATCQPVPDGTSCSDANACSTGDTCHAGVCSAGAAEDCGPCLTCDPGAGCVAHVLSSCHQPTERFSGELEITARPTRKIEWFWVEGEATTRAEIGNPLGDDRYAFCLFDESQSTPRLAFRAATRPDPCGKKSCWKPTGKTGFQYSAPASDELRKMVLKTGRDGKAKVTVIAKGPELALPPLPTSLPLRAQLHAENGQCWEARFFPLGASKNDAKIFRGKAFLQ